MKMGHELESNILLFPDYSFQFGWTPATEKAYQQNLAARVTNSWIHALFYPMILQVTEGPMQTG